jgi:hypothetical protein
MMRSVTPCGSASAGQARAIVAEAFKAIAHVPAIIRETR